jgi:hypothetical protein
MFSLQAQSQPGINSIYSSYGIGDVNIRDMNSYTSMGGVGIAIASDKGINGANPASFAFIPYGTYGMDLSFTGKNITYKNESQSFKANDFVINGAAFSFSLSKKAGASVSLKRYSTAEYYILANRYLEGTNSKLSETITGSGGLYLASAGFGVKLGKALSVSDFQEALYLARSILRKRSTPLLRKGITSRTIFFTITFLPMAECNTALQKQELNGPWGLLCSRL